METNTENWKDHLQKGGSLMIVILGNILYALAVKLFLMPAGLLTGGTTGIGLALNRSFGIPVATFVLIFNVTMLLIGWKVMGRKFMYHLFRIGNWRFFRHCDPCRGFHRRNGYPAAGVEPLL